MEAGNIFLACCVFTLCPLEPGTLAGQITISCRLPASYIAPSSPPPTLPPTPHLVSLSLSYFRHNMSLNLMPIAGHDFSRQFFQIFFFGAPAQWWIYLLYFRPMGEVGWELEEQNRGEHPASGGCVRPAQAGHQRQIPPPVWPGLSACTTSNRTG